MIFAYKLYVGNDCFLEIYRLTNLESKEYVLKVPPSPSLSACRITRTYLICGVSIACGIDVGLLTVTIIVRVQIIIDRTPTRSLWEGGAVKVEEYT